LQTLRWRKQDSNRRSPVAKQRDFKEWAFARNRDFGKRRALELSSDPEDAMLLGAALQAAINRYLGEHNRKPKPLRLDRQTRSHDREGQSRVPRYGSLALPDKPSIAALPFCNLSGDPEQQYFADGTVEEIITSAQPHSLALISGDVERRLERVCAWHSIAGWPRLTAHISRFSSSPNPSTLSKVSTTELFFCSGGYLLEDYPRLLDAERPDHDRRNQRARNQQPQEPTRMVRAPRIERAEQRHPAPGAEMP
jgi:hypothetical protein